MSTSKKNRINSLSNINSFFSVVIHAREEVDFNRYRFVIHVCNFSFRLADDLNRTNSAPVIAWFMKSKRFDGLGQRPRSYKW
jgi:hypothetical protein